MIDPCHRTIEAGVGGVAAERRQPKTPWREAAIWLRGDERTGYAVLVERDGLWIEVIKSSGGLISHIVEVPGIDNALGEARV